MFLRAQAMQNSPDMQNEQISLGLPSKFASMVDSEAKVPHPQRPVMDEDMARKFSSHGGKFTAMTRAGKRRLD
jgi:hypothetical protein